MANLAKILQQILLKALLIYRWIFNPLLGNCCRFHPSCSHYAEEAIVKYGAIYGSFLTVKRLLRCHPWHLGGVDEVP